MTNEEPIKVNDLSVDEINVEDIAALLFATVIWLGQQNDKALGEIGFLADAMRERFLEQE